MPNFTLSQVLIVGGGPAGAATGIVCARNGLSTVILEKDRYPVDKACGEGIMPTGVHHLRHLGVDACLDPADFYAFDGIRYISTGRSTAEARFHERPGWGIDRRVLSTALERSARSYPDLQLIDGVKAESLALEDDRFSLRAAGHEFRARLVIGADGINSTTRKWLGNPTQKPLRQRWGIRQHYQIAPWGRFVEVYWSNGIEAYITPVSPVSINLAFLWDRVVYRPAHPGQAILDEMLERFPLLQRQLKGAAPIGPSRAVGPMERKVAQTAEDGIVLIGDSAGYVDAITGEGISLALASAVLFEQCVIPILKANPKCLPKVADLAPFTQRQSATYRNYSSLAHLALAFSNRPRLSGGAIRLLAHRPRLFQFLLSCNQGTEQLWPGIIPHLIGSS
jgi:flavin-dependent dehydrogenase